MKLKKVWNISTGECIIVHDDLSNVIEQIEKWFEDDMMKIEYVKVVGINKQTIIDMLIDRINIYNIKIKDEYIIKGEGHTIGVINGKEFHLTEENGWIDEVTRNLTNEEINQVIEFEENIAKYMPNNYYETLVKNVK